MCTLPLLHPQDVHVQLQKLKANVSLLAIIAPLARVGGSESLTALYARTFERAAFGFAKVGYKRLHTTFRLLCAAVEQADVPPRLVCLIQCGAGTCLHA